MANPRVCILTETYHPVIGGGETQALSLALGLVAHGFSVVVLTRRSDASLPKIERTDGVTVYRLPPVGAGHLKKWGLLFSTIPALIQLRLQYDIIFVSGFRVLGITAVLVGKLLDKRCVLKADSLGEMSGEFFATGLARLRVHTSSFIVRLALSLRDAILKRAHTFVAISSEIGTELAIYGVNRRRIRAIPNSVDTQRFFPVSPQRKQELRRELNLSAQETIVTYTGRLVSYKGLALLLLVWQRIQQQHANLRLVLIGCGGLDIHNCERELRDFSRANRLDRSVLFTGSTHNVERFLQASDIFVFPTEREAFGISLIEAMACGLPVVSTAIGGIKDFLRHGENGLVVEPGNGEQLREALERLIEDTGLAAALGQAALRTVQEHYTEAKIISRYVELFRGMTPSTCAPS
jgi:glycosyltransferase involved in cell wall biosynthesis